MKKIILFAGVDPLSTGESDYAWHPLSVLSIGSVLRDRGFDVQIIDCQVDANWRHMIRAHAADALFMGVTCMTGPSIGNVLAAIEIARDVAPHTPLIWGGYHATLAHRGILREGLVDIVVRGPGEHAVLAIALRLADGAPLCPESFADVPNLAMVDGRTAVTLSGGTESRIVRTSYEFLGDMNALPPMNYQLIDPTRYYTETVQDLSYITSYGCPYGCAFCSEPQTSTRKWKPLAPERVASELAALWRRYAPSQISLLDPNFSTNIPRVVDIVTLLEQQDQRLELRANMRTRDVVNLAKVIDLKRLRKVGFSAIFLGCESGSDRMLKALHKSATVADTRNACQLLDEAGIIQLSSWIHDLPGEEVEDSQQTLELVTDLAALPHNRQKHHFFTPFPATELYEQLFGKTEDDNRTQAEWAASDTYASSALYAGRPEFRTRVLDGLTALKRRYPHALERALPRR
ncbi:B12-binding domain-containing radical SAM protein [Actinoplanes rectilineatus]|uniref:B12-binding domain-containing radical SAM protein n=1 Tax=Actinoplanes rectilineatus TaxID=113571 RepID=UPI0005F27BE9|nr:radical SAM protein [Actinoplanes rectilineatus]